MTSTNVPLWKKRRWQIFNNFLARPQVQRATKQFQIDFGFPEYSIIDVGRLVEKYKLPYECEAAYLFLIADPKATDQQLLSFIRSPIEWVSHIHKVMGPSKDPAKHYQSIVSRTPDSDSEEYSYVQLSIAPNTTAKEIRSFMDYYYTRHIKPLSKYPLSIIEERQPEEFNNPDKRVTNRELLNPIESDILRLGDAKQPAKEIQKYIHDRYDKLMELSDIRARLAKMRNS
jgi:hypothetical protein